jgi:hypothetical protein
VQAVGISGARLSAGADRRKGGLAQVE